MSSIYWGVRSHFFNSPMNAIMKYLICIFATLAVVHCELEKGLRVRFAQGLGIGEKYYIDIPKNVSEAVSSGWKETARPVGPLSSLVMYCSEERDICPLYDPDTGYVAGMQYAFDKSRISGQVLDWTAQGFVSWTTDDDREHWAQRQYFVNEDFLAKSKEDRLAAIDSDKLLQLGSIWLTGINGTLDRISTSRKDIEDSIFTIQGCVSGMGRHFFYNMSSTFECSSSTVYPWFLITDADGLVATGLTTTGVYNSTGHKEWFETVGREFVEIAAPYASDCYFDYGDNPGVIALHTYFVDKPLEIICPL